MRFVHRFLAPVLVLAFLAPSAYAATGVITVDLVKGTIDPPNPIVNVAAADAVEIRLVKDGKAINSFDYDIRTTINSGRTFVAGEDGKAAPVFDDPVFRQGTIVLNTKRCGWKETREDLNGITLPTGQKDIPCPLLLVTQNGYSTVYGEKSTITVNVQVVQRPAKVVEPRIFGWRNQMVAPAEALVPATLERYEVPFSIQLMARGSHLFWSLGMSWFDVRDEVYALVPSGTDKLKITPAGDGEVNYQVGANAHYSLSITRKPWSSGSVLFGLSANVPVDQLSAYAGLALTAWTLPDNDSGHIFVGVGYTRAARLAPEFRELTGDLVPTTTAVASLTRDEYDLGFVLGISFSFFGGQDQFKAVFPGKKSGGVAAEKEE